MSDYKPYLLAGSGVGALALTVWLWRTGGGLRGRNDLPREGRDVRGVEAPIWLVCAMMMFLGPMIGALIAAALPESLIGVKDSLKQNAVQQCLGYGSGLVVGGILVGLLRRAGGGKGGATRLGFTARPGDLLRGVLGLVMVAPFYIIASETATWIERMVKGEAGETIKHTTLKKLAAAFTGEGGADEKVWAWVIVVSVVVLVPVIEELMYRGFLQSFFVRALGGSANAASRTSDRLGAIVLTSTVFALMHVATGVVPWSAGAALFVLSMGLGIAFERTGRLGVSIVMHGLFNAVNVAAVVWG